MSQQQIIDCKSMQQQQQQQQQNEAAVKLFDHTNWAQAVKTESMDIGWTSSPESANYTTNNLSSISMDKYRSEKLCINRLGGSYCSGRPLPMPLREKIVELARLGLKPCQISKQLRVSHGCVSKLLTRWRKTGSIQPERIGGSTPKKVLPYVAAAIKVYKRWRPSFQTWQIRQRLITDGVCSPQNVPSISSINKCLRLQATEKLQLLTTLKQSGDESSSSSNGSAIINGGGPFTYTGFYVRPVENQQQQQQLNQHQQLLNYHQQYQHVNQHHHYFGQFLSNVNFSGPQHQQIQQQQPIFLKQQQQQGNATNVAEFNLPEFLPTSTTNAGAIGKVEDLPHQNGSGECNMLLNATVPSVKIQNCYGKMYQVPSIVGGSGEICSITPEPYCVISQM